MLYSGVPFPLILIRVVPSCRQQDEELDELSASVQRIGGVGLTIHEELHAQVSMMHTHMCLVVIDCQFLSGNGCEILLQKENSPVRNCVIDKVVIFQEKILDELGNEMDSTSNRLDFVQVKSSFYKKPTPYLCLVQSKKGLITKATLQLWPT